MCLYGINWYYTTLKCTPTAKAVSRNCNLPIIRFHILKSHYEMCLFALYFVIKKNIPMAMLDFYFSYNTKTHSSDYFYWDAYTIEIGTKKNRTHP